MINNAKDLIPPASENEIVLKLSRHFHDDIRTVITIRNIKNFENLIGQLDGFDQAGPLIVNPGKNGYNLSQSHRSYPNVYGETSFSNPSNFRRRHFVENTNQNNFGASANIAQPNTNYNYNRGPGSSGQTSRNNLLSFSDNTARYEGRNYTPTSHPGSS